MYDDILVPTDGSDVVDTAASHAIELASLCDATVHAVYAIEPDNATLPSEVMRHEEVHEEHIDWGEEITLAIADRARERGLEGVSAVTEGVPHEKIGDYAVENGIDLIVMGTAGRTGFRERLIGSVTEKTVRTAKVPVLTMRDYDAE
ncbi:universal stress protein [Halorubrum sp. N11]|uniref:universal stress protein n=1 Tax=Halorubrum sp. N11 TaxID=3402276 RepID=UPI003EB95DAC